MQYSEKVIVSPSDVNFWPFWERHLRPAECSVCSQLSQAVDVHSPKSVICRSVISQLGVLVRALFLLSAVGVLIKLKGTIFHSIVLLFCFIIATFQGWSLTVSIR